MFALIGQLTVDGVTMGMVYVILSAGIVFIMSVSRIFYLAYGQFYMLGAFVAWMAVETYHLPFLVALLFAVLVTAILGVLTYRFIFQYTTYSDQKFLATIVAAIGLMLVLSQSGLVIFGTGTHSIPSLFRGMVSGFDINVTVDKLVLLLVTIVVTLLLFLFYGRTGIGRAMRAVSFLPEVASLQGIDDKRICLISVGIGTALAGFAGAMIAPSYGIYPEMGHNVIVSVMLIAMLGGIDSLMGAVAGGIVVGLVLSFGQYFIGSYSQV
ncbi:MAG TPA: branched-chain amino acid ABC transporter permease, partial [Dehalococcoidia bacterium]|nr:branched-chain amino acid ABC transporter permease [Dehalococcoidia bacterium]